MEKRKLLAPSLTLAALLALGVGSTFALFTDSDQVDISVGAGKVEASVSLSNLKTYSGVDLLGNSEDSVTLNSSNEFACGGTAIINGDGDIVVTGMVAGDKVTFDLTLKDESTIDSKTRFSYWMEGDTAFRDQLIIKQGTNDLPIGKVVKYTDWAAMDAAKTSSITIDCPSTVTGNGGGSLTLHFRLDALQSNAKTEDYYAKISTPTDLKEFSREVNAGYDYEKKYVVQGEAIDMSEVDDFISIGTFEHPFKGKYDGKSFAINDLHQSNADFVSDLAGVFGVIEGEENEDIEELSDVYDSGTFDSDIVAFDKYTAGVTNLMVISSTGNHMIVSEGTESYTGAIAAVAHYACIEGCYVGDCRTASVGAAGGVVGTLDDSVVSGCYVSGHPGGFSTIAGGIAGRMGGHFTSIGSVITGCTVADCSIAAVAENGKEGGIVGMASGCDYALIHNCSFNGSFTAWGDVDKTGGIAGYCYANDALIVGCSASFGCGTAWDGNDVFTFVGGIAGLTNADIIDCKVNMSFAENGVNVAGIANFSMSSCILKNTTFSGNLYSINPSANISKYASGITKITFENQKSYSTEFGALNDIIDCGLSEISFVGCDTEDPNGQVNYARIPAYVTKFSCDTNMFGTLCPSEEVVDLTIDCPQAAFDMAGEYDGKLSIIGEDNYMRIIDTCYINELVIGGANTSIDVYGHIGTLKVLAGASYTIQTGGVIDNFI